MDDYAGRVLADRYRLPLPPSDEYELTETRAFDTYSGQEVLVRQVPLPEVVEAEVLGEDGLPDGFTARDRGARRPAAARTATRRPSDPAVRRAVEAAQAAARIPDHPRLDQVFDVFAEGGSLWIVSELVSAQTLATLLVEKPLSPYRAAEVAADVLMALRVLHAHGWVHRNITARTVLVCDDGRVMLTGLAVGAAEEALCGYDPVPVQDGDEDGRGEQGRHGGGAAVPASFRAQGGGAVPRAGSTAPHGSASPSGSTTPPGPRAPGGSTVPALPGNSRGSGAIGFGGAGGGTGTGAAAAAVDPGAVDPEAARRAAIEARAAGGLPGAGAEGGGGSGPSAALARREAEVGGDVRAARAGAIAAYRAGARAAARVQETQQPALPGARPPAEGERGTAQANGSAQLPYSGGNGVEQHPAGTTPPGQIADPYGVRNTAWHGATPRPGTGDPAPSVQGDRPSPPQQGGTAGAPSPGGTGTFPGTNTPARDGEARPYGSGASAFGPGVPAQGTDAPPYGREARPYGEDASAYGPDAPAPGAGTRPHGADPSAHGREARPHGADASAYGPEAPPYGPEAPPYGGDTRSYGGNAPARGGDPRPYSANTGVHSTDPSTYGALTPATGHPTPPSIGSPHRPSLDGPVPPGRAVAPASGNSLALRPVGTSWLPQAHLPTVVPPPRWPPSVRARCG